VGTELENTWWMEIGPYIEAYLPIPKYGIDTSREHLQAVITGSLGTLRAGEQRGIKPSKSVIRSGQVGA
jgi:hypothetical protein